MRCVVKFELNLNHTAAPCPELWCWIMASTKSFAHYLNVITSSSYHTTHLCHGLSLWFARLYLKFQSVHRWDQENVCASFEDISSRCPHYVHNMRRTDGRHSHTMLGQKSLNNLFPLERGYYNWYKNKKKKKCLGSTNRSWGCRGCRRWERSGSWTGLRSRLCLVWRAEGCRGADHLPSMPLHPDNHLNTEEQDIMGHSSLSSGRDSI